MMRLRTRRRPLPLLEVPLDISTETREVDVTPVVSWTVQQLQALGPATGPSHRSFVPIIRTSLPDNPQGDPATS